MESDWIEIWDVDRWDTYHLHVALTFPFGLSPRQQDWLEKTALSLVRECPEDEITDGVNVQDLIWQLHDAGPATVDAIIAEAEQSGLDPLTVLLQTLEGDRRKLQAVEEGEVIEARLR